MENLGSTELMNLHKIGYFASSKITSLSVLPTLDWAAQIAMQEDVAIVSGFQSKMEREVLDYLLKGRCGIICVQARSIYRQVPAKYKEAFNQNRVLFISEEKSPNISMVSKEKATSRNQLVATLADELIFSSLSPESSLFPLYQTSTKPKQIL